MSPDLDSSIQSGANEAFAELDLVDLNVILHRADGEEKDATGESSSPRLPLLLPPFHALLPLFTSDFSLSSSPTSGSLSLASFAQLTHRRRWSLHDSRLRIPSLLRSRRIHEPPPISHGVQ
jgi:hypothetical protein